MVFKMAKSLTVPTEHIETVKEVLSSLGFNVINEDQLGAYITLTVVESVAVWADQM